MKKKAGTSRGGKRGTKRAKDLAPKGAGAKGGYTLFLPDGTPVRAPGSSASQILVPGKVEMPN